jgi:hypothetical protein
MSSTKKDNIVKETTTSNTNQFKESTDRYLEQQRQQYNDTASNISEITENINQSANKFQEDNRRIFEKNTDIFRKSQEQINKTIQEVSNNAIELQKNVFDTYQSSYYQFFDNINNNSYWKNFNIPERYSEIYNKTNQNITDHTTNCSQRLNDLALTYTETFNKSIEIAQKYYDESVQNYFNFVNKIGRSYYYNK